MADNLNAAQSRVLRWYKTRGVMLLLCFSGCILISEYCLKRILLTLDPNSAVTISKFQYYSVFRYIFISLQYYFAGIFIFSITRIYINYSLRIASSTLINVISMLKQIYFILAAHCMLVIVMLYISRICSAIFFAKPISIYEGTLLIPLNLTIFMIWLIFFSIVGWNQRIIGYMYIITSSFVPCAIGITFFLYAQSLYQVGVPYKELDNIWLIGIVPLVCLVYLLNINSKYYLVPFITICICSSFSYTTMNYTDIQLNNYSNIQAAILHIGHVGHLYTEVPFVSALDRVLKIWSIDIPSRICISNVLGGVWIIVLLIFLRTTITRYTFSYYRKQ